MRTTLFPTLCLLTLVAVGCAGGAPDPQQELRVTGRMGSSTDEALALPDCTEVGASPIQPGVLVIRQVAGSESLYVLLRDDKALCSGAFTDVASSVPPTRSATFDTTDWSGSNPMPGRTGMGSSNPMPGAPSGGHSHSGDSADAPDGKSPPPSSASASSGRSPTDPDL